MERKQAIHVAITGAAGQVSYALIPLICQGLMFGLDQPLILQLCEAPGCESAWDRLQGLIMEIEDSDCPLVDGIIATTNPHEAFLDADVALLIGSSPRKEGETRRELLAKNTRIFMEHGRILEKVAKKSVKVLVVGNPANSNCMIVRKFAPSIPTENFSALTRLDQNRARALLAQKAGVKIDKVHNVFSWGNHSPTQYPDVNHGYIEIEGKMMPIAQVINDENWLATTFVSSVQMRGEAIVKARKLSSAASAAKAVVDHMRDWWMDTQEIVSMAIVSDGSYGVKEGIVFSFPVTITNGKPSIVKNLRVSPLVQQYIDESCKELEEERDLEEAILKNFMSN